MLVKPIPNKLLPHSVTYMPYEGTGRNGAVLGDEIPLNNVAVDYKSIYTVNGNNQAVHFKAVVYYDCRNSTPTGISFKEKGIITHNGDKMVIESVTVPNWIKDVPHHYELGCV